MSMSISSINSNMNFDAASMFKKMDLNSDGGIDKEEFTAAGKKNDANSEKIFSEFDTNNDGKIDETENESALKRMSQKGAPPPPPSSSESSSSTSSTSETYDEMDLNQDGTVTTEEKLQYVMQLLEQNDSIDTTEYTYNQFGQSENSSLGTLSSLRVSA